MKLIIDTSACSRIARSPHRRKIEDRLDSEFRRVLSVPTFWELLHQIEGGDGRHFPADKEVIKVASGAKRRPMMLPNPLSYAVQTVLKLPPLIGPLPPEEFKKGYELVMKARTRDELYTGVPVIRGAKQVRQFAPEIVRQQQEEGEQAHIERLKWAKRRKLSFLPPDEWVRAMMKQTGISLDDQQLARLATSLDAAYQFDMKVWKVATAPNSQYNPENHGNDWIDMQQAIYLCDPSIHLLSDDGKLVAKVKDSNQGGRVLHLADYLGASGLSL